MARKGEISKWRKEGSLLSYFEGAERYDLDILQQAVDFCLAKSLKELDGLLSSEELSAKEKIMAVDTVVRVAKYVEERVKNKKEEKGRIEIDSSLRIISELPED